MPELKALAEKLSTLSEQAPRVEARSLAWPATFDPEAWAFAPGLSALAGHPALAGLDEAARKRLAFFEAVNFFSLNINGERALIEGLARRCYRPETSDITGYLHHFLEEESQHMRIFGEFCLRYAGKVYPDRKVVFPRNHAAGEEDFLFWAKIMLFEETADAFNVRMMHDATLDPLVQAINRIHHQDESRHLAFGRRMVRDLWEAHAASWSAETREGVRAYLVGYLQSVWKEYHQPGIFRDAGLPDAYDLSLSSFETKASRERRRTLSRSTLSHLTRLGVFEEAPSL
ncbi:MAG: diiron oxygenase [Candidatus Sericytochromatia bacterium]|nr:diiron oxygenase [Candidatus Sericytochromatia bacterium]